ncbi:MAG: hypothetical protein K2K12_05135, partial [Clostridia bacterium]|nr:hypothetical protein [Clostridia bacterium]
MKNDKNFKLNLLFIILAPALLLAGVLMEVLTDNKRLTAFGYALILLGVYFFLMWLMRVLAARSANKGTRQDRTAKKKLDNLLKDALRAVENKTDYPETNTLRLVGEGLEFFAEGRYVCQENFKDVKGNHFAFEINSTSLKHMPEGYNDVCDLEGCGVLVAAGYHDGEALEQYANDNGIILKAAAENSVGQTIPLRYDKGYRLYVQTAEADDAYFGFVKILKCEDDVLTVYFSINVPYGLCDTVEGTVELKKETLEAAHDIHTLISRIKRKRYNVIEVKNEEIEGIGQANPFLQESYMAFLREVGFTDLDWINVGWNNNTPTNLNDDEIGSMNDV